MVKFGKRLLQESRPQWRQYYLNYKQLKTDIKELVGDDTVTVDEVTKHYGSVVGEAVGGGAVLPWEGRFQELLEFELDKVDKFSRLQTNAIFSDLRDLGWQCRETTAEEAPALEERIDRVASDLVALHAFVDLNFMGFQKITKKFDKLSASATKSWFMARVEQGHFVAIDFDKFFHCFAHVCRLWRKRCGRPDQPVVEARRAEKPQRIQEFFVDHSSWFELQLCLLKNVPLARSIPEQDAEKFLAGTRGIAEVDEEQRAPAASEASTSVWFDNDAFEHYTLRRKRRGGDDLFSVQWEGSNSFEQEKELVVEGAPQLTEEDECYKMRDTLKVKQKQFEAVLAGDRANIASGPSGSISLAKLSTNIREDSLRPVARATYHRARFGTGELCLLLDRDIWVAAESADRRSGWCAEASTVESWEQLAVNTLTLITPADLEVPAWVGTIVAHVGARRVQDFSKRMSAIALLYTKNIADRVPAYFSAIVSTAPATKGSDNESDTPPPSSGLYRNRATSDLHSEDSWGNQPTLGRPASVDVLFRGTAASLMHDYTGSTGTDPDASRRRSPMDLNALRGDGTEPLLAPCGRTADPGLLRQLTWQERLRLWWHGGLFATIFGGAGGYRRRLVRVEPKTYLALERTLISWLHIETVLAAIGIALLASEEAPTRWCGYACCLAAVVLAVHSARVYVWRCAGIQRKSPMDTRDYDDFWAPFILLICLASIVAALLGVAVLRPLAQPA
mmetsp:Transcript_121758/g.279001  ORF Transcript_121758/g.279001 Transcript_121758/m.279001 type:complete len:734 (+) Transcript_121758:19-2220(+)